MNDSLYDKAKALLWQEYHQSFDAVRQSAFHKAFVDEKIKHSFQVAGAGNGILAHEPYFQDKSAVFIEIAKTAILLHDVYRFREVRGWFETGQKIDHSIEGAKFLKTVPDFNNILITLPIKHHGHMIEELYADEEYLSLDEKTKDKVKHISFAVRDADKIANWNLVCSHGFDDIRHVWLPYPDDQSKVQSTINPLLLDYFFSCRVSPNKLRETNAETVLSIFCWVFDMNYEYSILYCKRLNLFEVFYNMLAKLGVEERLIKRAKVVVEKYVKDRFDVAI